MGVIDHLFDEVKADADSKGADLIALILRQLDREEQEVREHLESMRGSVCEHAFEMKSYFAVKKVWIKVKRVVWRAEFEGFPTLPRLMRGWLSPCSEQVIEDIEAKELRLRNEWRSQRRRYRQLTPCGSCWMCRTKKQEVWKHTKPETYYQRRLANERRDYYDGYHYRYNPSC